MSAPDFRWVKLNPDIASVFEFRVHNLLCIPTRQTFGSNTSPSSWEVFSQARMEIGFHIIDLEQHILPTLRATYHSFTDVSKRALSRTSPINSAYSYTANKGVYRNGRRLPTEMNIYVDDNLMADIQPFINDAIIASKASNFEVLVQTCPDIRRVSLVDDKFRQTALSICVPNLAF